jgi:MYXO-CTERM domain-containing protein
MSAENIVRDPHSLTRARTKVDDLSEALASGSLDARQRITQLGLRFKLVTPFTSFVAVDDSRGGGDGDPRRVVQPAERSEGVDLDMAGGHERKQSESAADIARIEPRPAPAPEPAPKGAPKTDEPPPAELPSEQQNIELHASEAAEESDVDQGESLGDICAIDPAACPQSDMAEQSSTSADQEPYAVQQSAGSKRGCGCRTAGGGPALPGALLLLTVLGCALWRRSNGRCKTRA